MSGASSVQVSIYGGHDAYLRCYTYDEKLPILDIGAGASRVTVSPLSRVADEDAVTFARNLAEHVAVFAAEVERLHEAHKAAESEAA